MHSLTGFADLYPFGGNMGRFDEMACACGTHPSAYTKAAIGWLDAAAIASHNSGTADYKLHSVGLVQPPPSGRVTAVRIGSKAPYLMVEARKRVDQFDANIPSEGVIVYRVQTSDPLGNAQNSIAPIELLTTTALTIGQTFTSSPGIKVAATNAIPGGLTVHITSTVNPLCAGILQQIADIDALISEETELQLVKQLRAKRNQLRKKGQQLGCL